MLELIEQKSNAGIDEPMVHLVCACSEKVALCGWETSGIDADDEELACVVCEELNKLPCALCGALPYKE